MNLDLLFKLVRLANNNPNDNEANLAARKVCKMIAEANFNITGNTTPPNPRPQQRGSAGPFNWGHWSGFKSGYDYVKAEADRQRQQQERANEAARKQAEYERNKAEEAKREKEWTGTFYDEFHFGDDDFRKIFEELLEKMKREGSTYDYTTARDRFYGGGVGGGKSNLCIDVVFDASTDEYLLPNGKRISSKEFYADPFKYRVVNTINRNETKSQSPFPKKEYQPKKEKRPLKCCICGKERMTAFMGPPQVFRCWHCDWEDYEKEKAAKVT